MGHKRLITWSLLLFCVLSSCGILRSHSLFLTKASSISHLEQWTSAHSYTSLYLLCSRLLYDFQNSLTKQLCPHLHPKRHSKCNSLWILWQFLGKVAAVVERCYADGELWYLGGPHQDPVPALGHFQGQGGPSMLDSCPSHTALKPTFSGMALLLHHSAMTENHSHCLIVQPYFKRPISCFRLNVSTIILRTGKTMMCKQVGLL